MKERRASRFTFTLKKTTWKQNSGWNQKPAWPIQPGSLATGLCRRGGEDGYDARTLRELLGIVEDSKERIERAWNEFFG